LFVVDTMTNPQGPYLPPLMGGPPPPPPVAQPYMTVIPTGTPMRPGGGVIRPSPSPQAQGMPNMYPAMGRNMMPVGSRIPRQLTPPPAKQQYRPTNVIPVRPTSPQASQASMPRRAVYSQAPTGMIPQVSGQPQSPYNSRGLVRSPVPQGTPRTVHTGGGGGAMGVAGPVAAGRQAYGSLPRRISYTALMNRMNSTLESKGFKKMTFDQNPKLYSVMESAIITRLKRVMAALSESAHYRTYWSYEGAVSEFGEEQFIIKSDPSQEFSQYEKKREELNPPRPNPNGEDAPPTADRADGVVVRAPAVRQHPTVSIREEDFFAQREMIGDSILDLHLIRVYKKRIERYHASNPESTT